jgi:hypothetical protein
MRYIILIALNLPIILLAFVNILTQYKLKKISATRFRAQLLCWIIILVLLVGSFPLYNAINGHPLLYSKELTLFDIVQTAAIIYLFYIVNHQRQKIEHNDKSVRELHQELSIRLSTENRRS